MAEPHDYRYNPFTDVSTAVQTTERHLVPSSSPYIVMLNEVPQKASPSTMTVKIISSISGSTVTYGSTMTEVSTNPSSNQFWADYNTKADGDENWNTGRLLFNSANAGAMVEVTYMATGTLASTRKPTSLLPIEVDFGDGRDGSFTPTANTTISAFFNYANVVIPSGVTVTMTTGIPLRCNGLFLNYGTIANNGANGTKAGGSYSAGSTGTRGFCGGTGGAGGKGGTGAGGAGGGNVGNINSYGAIKSVIAGEKGYCGGNGGGGGGRNIGESDSSYRGGTGGTGGGGIVIFARTFINKGKITANGGTGGAGGYWGGGGGGGGGGVVLVGCLESKNDGTITVNGGAGGSGGSGGAAGSAGSTGAILIFERKISL